MDKNLEYCTGKLKNLVTNFNKIVGNFFGHQEEDSIKKLQEYCNHFKEDLWLVLEISIC